ncbi:MAG: hypothetical protein ABSD11_20425 [Methylocella sp.]
MRVWFSGPHLFNGLVRPGISLGREDFRRGRLPSWRKYEYRKALKAYAEKHGEHLTDEDANYKIDRAVAMGELDAGGPTLHLVGSREEIIAGILDSAEKFGLPVDRNSAEKITDQAIRNIWAWRILKWVFWGGVATIALAVFSEGKP